MELVLMIIVALMGLALFGILVDRLGFDTREGASGHQGPATPILP